MNDEVLTYQDLEHNCPLSCPFVRKIQEKHIFLCTEYRVFLEINKYGLPRRSGKCGIKEVDNAKEVLKSLNAHLDNGLLTLTREDKDLLKNVMLILDSSEREVLDMVLKTQSLAKTFCDSFNKQSKDASLVANTRGLLKEYEKKYFKTEKDKNHSRSEEEKEIDERKRQEQLRLLLEKNREKSGRNG